MLLSRQEVAMIDTGDLIIDPTTLLIYMIFTFLDDDIKKRNQDKVLNNGEREREKKKQHENHTPTWFGWISL